MADYTKLDEQFVAYFARNLEGGVNNDRYFGPELGDSPPVVNAVLEAFEDAVNTEIAENTHDRERVLEAMSGISRAWKLLSRYWDSVWYASQDRDAPSDEDVDALHAAFDAAGALGLPVERIFEDALTRFGETHA